LITAFNVFAHSDNLKVITLNAFDLLKKDGTFVIEVQYLLDTIRDLTFDNIYHEHYNYWSVLSLKNFFENLGLQVSKVQHVDTHGGSIRVYVTEKTQNVDESVDKFIKEELEFGLDKLETYREFEKRIQECKEETVRKINDMKENGDVIVGYGSPAKATTVLNYYGIDNQVIDYIIEDNELKHDKLLPGVRIPIKGKDDVVADKVLVLAWNFFDYIKQNNKDLIEKGCEFITLKD